MPEGPNELRVTALDEAGRSAEAAINVSVDSVPPALILESPQSGLTNQASARVVGTAEDANGVARVEVAGVEVAVVGGAFERNVALQEGSNLIEVRAFDIAGNGTEIEIEIERFTPPQVVIESPADLSYLAATTVDVSGSVSDHASSVAVNGVPANVNGSSFVAPAVPLIEGGNVITAVVTSSLGRVGSDSVNVVRDLMPPRLAVHYPREGSKTLADRIDVSGMVNDIVAGTVNASQATVTVNGVAAEVANRSFFVEGISLAVGDNVLSLVATDGSGNMGSAQVRVVREAAPFARITIVSGDRQTSVVGSTLPEPLVVELRDAADLPVAGRTVLFKVVGSDGTLDAGKRQQAIVTDANGRAETFFTLGTRAGVGNQVVQVVASSPARSLPPPRFPVDRP